MTSTTTWTFPPSSADVGDAPSVLGVTLAPDVEGWFTGARLGGLADANLAHHVPHAPDRLAAARGHVGAITGTDPQHWHLMRQVHGADVAVIDESTPPGAEIRDVDGLVTLLPERPLVVLSADCVPILAAGRQAVGVAHAGWRGIAAGVLDALIAALGELGEAPEDLRIALGPAIGPCCYEVGPEVVESLMGAGVDVASQTRTGRPSVDLPGALRIRADALGVGEFIGVGGPLGPGGSLGEASTCTSCDRAWFSHRRDPRSGRQAGIIVRRGPRGQEHR
jgi:YfiH family protein